MAAPQPSVYLDCLNAVAAAIAALGLAWNGRAASVLVRKLPIAKDLLGGGVPVIVVVIDDGRETVEPAGYEGWTDVGYPVEVVTVLPAQLSSSVNLDYVLSWRERTRRLFQILGTVALPPSVYDVEVDPKAPYDRGAFDRDYDQHLLTVKLHSNELAS